VAAYRRGLPEGWGSYPECRASASLLGSLAKTGALEGLEDLPEELVPYLTPRDEAWIPEVAHVAILLALRDQRFGGNDGEEAFLAWLNKLNGALLPDRSDIGPQAAVREFPAIWSSLHRGTELRVIEARLHEALLACVYPEPLFPAIANRWRRDAIAAYLVKAGAAQPRSVELGREAGATRLALAWK
jgi:hypothetical protein